MPDYKNGKIYKIVNDENDDVYYGSTSAIMLSKRFGDHKRDYRCYLNGKGHFRTSFNIVKYESCKIILVENFPCNSKYELEARERYYIENYNCVNIRKPAKTNTADYKNGKIYKIINDETDDEYYGSTIKPLKERFGDHKRDYRCYLNGKSEYISSFEIVKYSSCKIVLVENFPCNSKYELEVREKYYIKNFKCVNKVIPTRSKKEYREDNKVIIREKSKKRYETMDKQEYKKYQKQYQQDNKEKIKKQRKQYRHDNKEKIKERNTQYRLKNIEKIAECQKQYQQDNKEKIKKQKKQYRHDNKEKIKEQKRQYRLKNIEKILEQKRQKYKYQTSWGGDKRTHNNLLEIDIHLFT